MAYDLFLAYKIRHGFFGLQNLAWSFFGLRNLAWCFFGLRNLAFTFSLLKLLEFVRNLISHDKWPLQAGLAYVPKVLSKRYTYKPYLRDRSGSNLT